MRKRQQAWTFNLPFVSLLLRQKSPLNFKKWSILGLQNKINGPRLFLAPATSQRRRDPEELKREVLQAPARVLHDKWIVMLESQDVLGVAWGGYIFRSAGFPYNHTPKLFWVFWANNSVLQQMSTDITLFLCVQNISIFKSCWNTFKSHFLGGSGEEETGGVSVIGRNLEKYAEKVGQAQMACLFTGFNACQQTLRGRSDQSPRNKSCLLQDVGNVWCKANRFQGWWPFPDDHKWD